MVNENFICYFWEKTSNGVFVENFLTELEDVSIWATTLDGDRINDLKIDKTTFVIIGNEGNGIRDEIRSKADKCIAIDKLGQAESLNAAVATGIICYALSWIFDINFRAPIK